MRLLFLFGVLLISAHAVSQNATLSPYSRYALGELRFGSSSTTIGLGGTYVAFADTSDVNYGNPASYALITPQRPVFDIGIRGNYTRFNTSTQTTSGGTSGIRNMTLGIPVSRRFGGAFGLAPYSTIGYRVVSTQLNEDGSDIHYVYEGDGGLNTLFAGLAFAPIKNEEHVLSVGVNASFLFGTLDKERRVIFDNYTYFNTLVYTRSLVRDFSLDFGVYYSGKISDNSSFRFGAKYGMQRDLSASRDELATTFFYSSGLEQVIDTLEVLEDEEGYLRMPQRFSYGVGYDLRIGKGKVGLLSISAQLDQMDWDNYMEVFGSDTTNGNFRRSNQYALGIQYQPYSSIVRDLKYHQVIKYRAGIRLNKSHLSINDQEINDYGISFGLGLPLLSTRSTSSINLGVEVGKRGTIDNSLIEENYLNLFVGFTMTPTSYNRWFVKRKYK